ncbi:MAG: class I SAM-dependent methyltransferase [Caldilineaceae bacterium]
MRMITHTLIANHQQHDGPVLELGCGSGIFLQELQLDHPQQLCIGLDRSGLALGYANDQLHTQHLTQADLRQLPFANERFALVVALDVFDQQAVSLQQALQESWRILQSNGLLLLRVSAHPWLHSPHDAAFNTGRRYRRREVVATLRTAAFHVERVTYANTLLAPPVILQRFLQRWNILPFAPSHRIAPQLHQQIVRLLRWEAQLLRSINLPFGISLYVLARKSLSHRL